MPDTEPEPAEAISPSSQDVADGNTHPASLDTLDQTKSLKLPKNDLKANDSHQGLKIITLVDPNEDHVDGQQPDIE
jgi:hypothetical protein